MDYTLYTGPIEITKKEYITATTDPNSGEISKRLYYPEKPALYYMKYRISDGTDISDMIEADYEGWQDTVFISTDDNTRDVYIYTDAFGEVKGENNAEKKSDAIRINLNGELTQASISVSRAGIDDNNISIIVYAYKLGDCDGSSKIDAKDASLVLMHYSALSTGGQGIINDSMRKYADYNKDSVIDARDASAILKYYSEVSTQLL